MTQNRFADEAERIARKARRLLNDVGWDATRAQLEHELDHSHTIVFDAEDRGSILARAEGLQRAQRNGRETAPAPVAENPIPAPAADEEPMAAEPEVTFDREEAREFLREQRIGNKELGIPEARDLMREKYGIDVAYAAFYSTYWKKSEPTNGRRKGRAASNGKHARKAPGKSVVRRAVTPPPVATSNGVAVVVGEPIAQILKLSDGNVRIQFDMAPELGGVLQTLGAALSARKEQVA